MRLRGPRVLKEEVGVSGFEFAKLEHPSGGYQTQGTNLLAWIFGKRKWRRHTANTHINKQKNMYYIYIYIYIYICAHVYIYINTHIYLVYVHEAVCVYIYISKYVYVTRDQNKGSNLLLLRPPAEAPTNATLQTDRAIPLSRPRVEGTFKSCAARCCQICDREPDADVSQTLGRHKHMCVLYLEHLEFAGLPGTQPAPCWRGMGHTWVAASATEPW